MKDKVIKTECHEKITGRTRVSGDYSKHECAITISAVRLEDAGLWQCELESYVLGITRGYRKTQNVMVAVAPPTTNNADCFCGQKKNFAQVMFSKYQPHGRK